MIEAHIHEWLNLVVRWIHMVTGIAWIGASFYFNWVEGQLNRRGPNPPGIAGDLWAVHVGGFYNSQKYQVAPEKLPEKLHWFKWEAYMTWVSGMALLVIVYFWQAESYMVDPAIAARSYPIHNFEVWLSQKLGVSLMSSQNRFIKRHKKRKK